MPSETDAVLHFAFLVEQQKPLFDVTFHYGFASGVAEIDLPARERDAVVEQSRG